MLCSSWWHCSCILNWYDTLNSSFFTIPARGWEAIAIFTLKDYFKFRVFLLFHLQWHLLTYYWHHFKFSIMQITFFLRYFILSPPVLSEESQNAKSQGSRWQETRRPSSKPTSLNEFHFLHGPWKWENHISKKANREESAVLSMGSSGCAPALSYGLRAEVS